MNNNYHGDKIREVSKSKKPTFNWKTLSIFAVVIIVVVLLANLDTKDTDSLENNPEVTTKEQTLGNNVLTQSKTSVPSTVLNTSPKVSIASDGAFLIRLTNDGFIPNTLQIKSGGIVRFVNDSDKAMRIFADEDKDQTYISIKQPKSVGRGETYDVVFTRTGIWFYNNQNQQVDTGNITVF